MKRINVLDNETSNKIAAGEVIERPLSVVKELVENSIDSGAKNITIELMEGGEKVIRVIDDGSGIHEDDVEKAFLPHATSKISEIEDLFKVKTLGFRGEALPSVASVSRVNLVTKTADAEFGISLELEGGRVVSKKQAGTNNGTKIEVNDLFYNVPARKKFLKSNQREAALINDIVSRIALAHPEVSFKLYSNNKLLLNTIGNNNIKDTILSIYGKTTSNNVSEFEGHCDIASIHGFLGNQELSRGNRNNQSIFINGRYIKNRMIATAVENAVKSFFMINKFPFFILYLDIFPEMIDVNVHPTKAEVKFQDERTIFKLVFDAVHSSIRNSLKEALQQEEKDKYILEEADTDALDNFTVQLPIDLKSREVHNDADINSVRTYHDNISNNTNYPDFKSSFTTGNDNFRPSSTISNNDFKPSSYNSSDYTPYTSSDNVISESSREDNYQSRAEASYEASNNEETHSNSVVDENHKYNDFSLQFRPIGQLGKTYILLEGIDGLYLLDQHAAHEKVIFTKYLKQLRNENVSSQILLTSQVVELTNDDFNIYNENKDIFDKTGFKIELFGDNTINIREVPILLGKPEVKTLFLEILDNLRNLGNGSTIEVKYNKIASLACKSAVKANDELKDIEIKALISSLEKIEDPFNCPHGRPTIIKITFNELEKRFKRIV
ncbi:MAG: DNA mismatch repair endonuclease MutL [Clostridiaceae bacterium]